jgi:transcriptional regulator with XRE-family HTH domain
LAEIAHKTGTTAGYISRLRSGQRNPSRKWLAAFVEQCRLDADEISVAAQLFNAVRESGLKATPMSRINPVTVLRPEDV